MVGMLEFVAGVGRNKEGPRFALLVNGKEVFQGICGEKTEEHAVSLQLKPGKMRIGLAILNEDADPKNPLNKSGVIVHELGLIGPLMPVVHTELLAAPKALEGDAKSRHVIERFAKGLAPHRGALYLDSVSELSDEAAEALKANSGVGLVFEKLNKVSDKALITLAQSKGNWLVLNGLTTISDDVFKAIAQHAGRVKLTRVTTLSDEGAKALAQHKGSLFLTGVTTLSPEAIKVLRARKDGNPLPANRFR